MTTAYKTCGFFGFGKKKFDLETICPKDTKMIDYECVPQYPNTMYNILGTTTFEDAKKLVHPGCHLLSKKDLIDNRDTTMTFIASLKGASWVDAKRTGANTFVWNDGSNMTLGEKGHWAKGEPNNYRGKEGNVEVRNNGTFNDIPSNLKLIAVEVCPVATPY